MATSASGAGTATPITTGVALQSNALYNEETSMTPTVRRQQYTPSLSPELQQLEQLTSSVLRTGAFDLGSGGADTRYHNANGQLKLHQPVQQQFHPAVSEAAKVPKHYLRTTGDLFNMSDQDTAQV